MTRRLKKLCMLTMSLQGVKGECRTLSLIGSDSQDFPKGQYSEELKRMRGRWGREGGAYGTRSSVHGSCGCIDRGRTRRDSPGLRRAGWPSPRGRAAEGPGSPGAGGQGRGRGRGWAWLGCPGTKVWGLELKRSVPDPYSCTRFGSRYLYTMFIQGR
jgi:hypothetical protein